MKAAENTIRYLKNITGLWAQQLRQRADSDPTIGYGEISRAAQDASHITYAIDPNHESFIAP